MCLYYTTLYFQLFIVKENEKRTVEADSDLSSMWLKQMNVQLLQVLVLLLSS